MTWTAASGTETCGGCGLAFTPGQAMAQLTAKAARLTREDQR